MTNVATRHAKQRELIEEAFNRLNNQMNAEQINAQKKHSLEPIKELRRIALAKLVKIEKALNTECVKTVLPTWDLQTMREMVDFEIDQLKASFKNIELLKKYPNIKPLFEEYNTLSHLNTKGFVQKELRAIFLAISYAEMRKEEFTNINLSEMKEVISNQMSEASTAFVLNKLNTVD